MSKNLSCAIKADEELDERLNTPIPQLIQSIEIVFKRNFFEVKEQEVAFAQNQFSTASMLVISPMNYKTNFMNIKIIRQHVIFFQKRVLSLF